MQILMKYFKNGYRDGSIAARTSMARSSQGSPLPVHEKIARLEKNDRPHKHNNHKPPLINSKTCTVHK